MRKHKKKRKHSIQVQLRKRIEAHKEQAHFAAKALINPRMAKWHEGYEQSLGQANRRLATVLSIAHKRAAKGDKKMERILNRIGAI